MSRRLAAPHGAAPGTFPRSPLGAQRRADAAHAAPACSSAGVRGRSAGSGWSDRPLGAPSALRAWLADRGSLTQHLYEASDRLQVRRILQGRGLPCLDEPGPLQVPGPGRGSGRSRVWLVREVVLACNGVPAVFAHSVISAEALRGPWRWLAGLGHRPLGEALFRDPRIRRGPITYRHLRAPDRRYRSAVAQLAAAGLPTPARLWARRSVFAAGGRRLLVTEVFLPVVASLARPKKGRG